MTLRPFGSTDLVTSEFGLGCARIGGIFQQDPRSFLNLLAAARDHGINFFDTADMYSQGESETLLGRAFSKQRDRVVIASKAGYVLPRQRRLIATIKPFVRPVIKALRVQRKRLSSAVRGQLAQDFSPAYLRRAIEASLRRLKTDYIDLFQLHSVPLEIAGRDDWVGALESMKAAGKIRYYGVSCDDLKAGWVALDHPGVSSVQCVISLLNPEAAAQLIPRARERGVGVIARECLANGLLVKDEKDVDLKAWCHSDEDVARRTNQLGTLRHDAASRGRPLAAHAIDFVRGTDGVSVTLIGARTTAQLTGVLRATLERLDPPATMRV